MSDNVTGNIKTQLPVPSNWPEDIAYLNDLTYSAAVTSEQRTALGRTTTDLEGHARITAEQIATTQSRARIRIISDPKHPAHKQRGLFTASDLPPDSFILLYQGHVHTNSLSDTNSKSDYDLSLDRLLDLSVDACSSGNESRFCNDYRGITERPNAEFRDCFIQVPSEKRAGGSKWERRVGIFVLSAGNAGLRKKGIREGEEVCVSYGKQYWESRKVVAGFRKDAEMLRVATAALEL
ncbi:hypothetical protein B0A48_14563 [Cryoendolithus antarcticus]|uniref:SET domain-containing protein n=1 Tax=Cryoendolithus antarcticus TaxID=1507870 RepID=A0A1V8SL44_9PEZI|nr:hypothetical protein B0A48_14563 [Cryoendolithus antarcticus]